MSRVALLSPTLRHDAIGGVELGLSLGAERLTIPTALVIPTPWREPLGMLNLATKFAPHVAAFAQAVEAGFHCAELWTDAAVLADWEQVAERARQFPLRYVIHFPNRKEQSVETLRHAAALYRALDCQALVIHQPHYDRYADALRRIDPELCLAIENHRLRLSELETWFAQSPHLTLDVEHVWKYTLQDAPLEELLDLLDQQLAVHGDKLRHVHLPGYWPGMGEHRPMYAAREMIFPVWDLLARREYNGLIVSETEMEYQTPQDLRMDVLLFETWQSRAPQERRPATTTVSRAS